MLTARQRSLCVIVALFVTRTPHAQTSTSPAPQASVSKAGSDLTRRAWQCVFDIRSRTLPDDHRQLQESRADLAALVAKELARAGRSMGAKGEQAAAEDEARERCADLMSQALWEAKTRVREAQDESGKPRCSTRDWAAWVLTGESR